MSATADVYWNTAINYKQLNGKARSAMPNNFFYFKEYYMKIKVLSSVLLILMFSLLAVQAFAQTYINSIVDLWNIRYSLTGNFKQTVNLDLAVTNPSNVNVWASLTSYNPGDFVKYTPGSIQYTYVCKLATSSALPTNTTYWIQLWESAKGWQPIGSGAGTLSFRGVYDGDNKLISNLYINRGASACNNDVYPTDGEDNIGLFGYLENTTTAHTVVKNVQLINPNVTGRRGIGSLVGRVLLPVTTPARSYTVYIERCSAEASGVGGTATVTGFGATGGLVGANNSNEKQRVPVIRFSRAYVTVSATHPNNYTPNPNDRIGNTSVYNPYNIKYGGLVGCNENGVTQDCFARGNVSGGDRVGGLAGCTIGGSIFRSYATGTVTRGITPGNWEGGIGGLVGRTSGSLPPGLGGTNSTGSCEDCFWDTETSFISTSPGGTGKTTSEMTTQSTFTNWDFTNVWGINSLINDGYPYLRGNATAEFYYRSKADGNWNDKTKWQYSSDYSSWLDAIVSPDRANSISIRILSGHEIAVTQHVIIDSTTIDSGATLTINSGITLDVSNGLGADLTVDGDLFVTGVLNPEISSDMVFSSGSLITYNGSVAQVTGDYFIAPVYNLTLDNSAGLTFSKSIVINDLFTVTSGTYTLGSGASINTDGVYSPTVKYFSFPATGDNIVNYTAGMTTDVLFPDFVDRQWSISGTINSATRTKSITFYWTSADDHGFDWTGIAPAVFVGEVKYDATAYNTGTDPRTVTIDYTFASAKNGAKETFKVGRADDETLPVELSSFTATTNAYNYVQLMWVTQSETNVSGFRIYRGLSDAFDTADQLNVFIPATNTSQAQYYAFTDQELSEEGLYYYWLENVDMDGGNAFYGPVSVNLSLQQSGSPEIPVVAGINSLYPNPFNPSTTIRFGVSKDAKTQVVIYNARGQKVRQLADQIYRKGNHQLYWNGRDDNGQTCSSGIYMLNVTIGKDSYTRKAVLLK